MEGDTLMIISRTMLSDTNVVASDKLRPRWSNNHLCIGTHHRIRTSALSVVDTYRMDTDRDVVGGHVPAKRRIELRQA